MKDVKAAIFAQQESKPKQALTVFLMLIPTLLVTLISAYYLRSELKAVEIDARHHFQVGKCLSSLPEVILERVRKADNGAVQHAPVLLPATRNDEVLYTYSKMTTIVYIYVSQDRCNRINAAYFTTT